MEKLFEASNKLKAYKARAAGAKGLLEPIIVFRAHLLGLEEPLLQDSEAMQMPCTIYSSHLRSPAKVRFWSSLHP